MKEYFAGGRTVLAPREGYDETHVVPRCPAPAVQQAVHEAVERGTVWLTNDPASVWKEPIPYGVLNDDAVLRPPPDPIAAQELVADALPGAWRDGTTNGIALAQALSQKRGRTLPWGLVRDGIRAGVESRWLEMAGGSVAVSCGYDEAGGLRLARPAAAPGPDPAPPPPAPAGPLLEGSQNPGPVGAGAPAAGGQRGPRSALPRQRGPEDRRRERRPGRRPGRPSTSCSPPSRRI